MKAMRRFITVVDAFNYRLGRLMMFGIFVLMGVLLWSTFSKAAGSPSLWTLEMAQFIMVGYYILGGPYAIQMGSNVRMDLFYGDFSPRRKAWFDAITVFFLLTYLGVLLWGGIESTIYAFQYGGERSSSVWRPYIWPIKVIMCTGITLMLLQSLSELFKDIIFLRTGKPMRPDQGAGPDQENTASADQKDAADAL
ncbi:TRAP transporter small permease subunit [Pseudooceanicola nitratireducens]|uniref:TRAP transporter small permease subunit n=1 Tax=Pseudooceanicola nitratireducens TaxID=517719 RepID=UPI001C95D41B|nr:TRAP transporter small permease subunit [Pseudooceanicola nitratireducens]MBY6158939.1 TRAP transporter small permease subunit [Pseudooceanicola nitratireducens]MEC7297333.1 TRAP transporter small permease subunit [Pseudomonadota bacterium]MEC7794258.1 TRAP transporter small permease subunit [Pseudomonadota bacterium]